MMRVVQQEAVVEKVLEFQFYATNSKKYSKTVSFWFNLTPNIDFEIQQNFLNLYQNARNDALSDLKETLEGTLTLLILFDQIPQHIFHGTKNAFETDTHAVALAKVGILKGLDQRFPDCMRPFFYFLLENSEPLEDKEQSVMFCKSLRSILSKICTREFYDD